jgi:hypothetical protein
MTLHPYRIAGLVASLAVIVILGTGMIDNLTGRHLDWSGKLPFPSADLKQHHYAAGVAHDSDLTSLYRDSGSQMKNSSYVYPPLLPRLMASFSGWDYRIWCWAWLAISLLCLFASAGQLHAILCLPAPRGLTILWLFGLPVAFYTLIIGQNSALSLVIFTTSAYLLHRQRPLLAGLVLASLFYKPHLIALAGLFMLSAGKWRWCLGVVSASAALWLGALIWFGWEPHQAWVETIFNMSSGARHQPEHLNQSLSSLIKPLLHQAPDWWRGGLLLGIGLGLTAAAGAGSRLLRLPPGQQLLFGLGAILLTSPYLLHYDLLLGAGCWLMGIQWMEAQRHWASRLSPLLFWSACLLSINPTHFTLSPSVLLLVMWFLLIILQAHGAKEGMAPRPSSAKLST